LSGLAFGSRSELLGCFVVSHDSYGP
jgi:hypothetical protein